MKLYEMLGFTYLSIYRSKIWTPEYLMEKSDYFSLPDNFIGKPWTHEETMFIFVTNCKLTKISWVIDLQAW